MIKLNRQLGGGDTKYGTHMVPLITAVQNTRGDIFEMGCGDFSTPLLHAVCLYQKRSILSADTSLEWLNLFKYLENDFHTFKYVDVYEDDWEKNPKPHKWDDIGNREWGVVFVDHRPGERRKDDIKRLKDKAQIIVVHDTEYPGYGYEPILNLFKYRFDYKIYSTQTTLVSNKMDVSKLFPEFNN